MENNSKNNYLAISVVVAAILIVGAIIYVGGKNNSSPSQAVSQSSGSVMELASNDVILGNKNAPVTLIEYGDYQCPYCAMFQQQIEPALNIAYIQTGKVRMIFREMSFVGAESQTAAEASYCANDQGKFWDYHDLIYKTKLNDYENNAGKENDGALSENVLLGLADQLKLNHAQFAQCLDGKKYADAISSDNQAAQSFGVNSTPTVFINGKEMSAGVLPLGDYQKAIDAALSAAK